MYEHKEVVKCRMGKTDQPLCGYFKKRTPHFFEFMNKRAKTYSMVCEYRTERGECTNENRIWWIKANSTMPDM